MRILQVASALLRDWGGIEKYVASLAPELTLLGQEVVVARPAGSPIADRCATPGINLKVSRRFDPFAAAAYLRTLRSQRFDLLVTHFSRDYLIPAWAARVTGVKTIMTRHVAVPLKARRVRQYRRLYDGFLGVSDAVAGSLLKAGFPSDQTTYAHTGFPGLVSLEPAATKGGEFNVGVFGRLVPEKGQEYAILAAQKSDVTLHLFGDGPDGVRLRGLAAGTARVIFHGYVTNIADEMMRMNVITVPSTWDEAFSIAVLEAMSLGRPIVASQVGGIPEVIFDQETGWLVPPRDANALVQAWTQIANHPEEAAEIGSKAQALHRAEYMPASGANRILSAYQRLID